MLTFSLAIVIVCLPNTTTLRTPLVILNYISVGLESFIKVCVIVTRDTTVLISKHSF
jgi:hypothetical protein